MRVIVSRSRDLKGRREVAMPADVEKVDADLCRSGQIVVTQLE